MLLLTKCLKAILIGQNWLNCVLDPSCLGVLASASFSQNLKSIVVFPFLSKFEKYSGISFLALLQFKHPFC